VTSAFATGERQQIDDALRSPWNILWD